MFTVWLLGSLAVCGNALCWWGAWRQIRHTYVLGSVSGLSLFEAESRIWGKLPWFLFAFSLSSVDWPVVAANGVGVLLAMGLLFFFLRFGANSKVKLRVVCQILLLGAVVSLAAFYRDMLIANRVALALLPIPVSIAALVLGNSAQLLLTRRCQDASGICVWRYAAFLLSGLLWILYGAVKGSIVGWDESLTIVSVASIGVVMNGALLLTILTPSLRIYREPSERAVPA